MSSVAEIEAAVERLHRQEQDSLLANLVRKLGSCPTPTSPPQTQREIWLRQLDRLRARGTTLAGNSSPLQELLDDIRTERLP